MNISNIAIKNPLPTVVLFLILAIAGARALDALVIQDLPDIELPEVIITTSLTGASPAQLETEVIKKIESSLSSVQGIRHIYSSTSLGSVLIRVEFQLEKSMQDALDETKDAITSIRSKLPSDLNEPVVSKKILADEPILRYAIEADGMTTEHLSWFVDDSVSKVVQTTKGVGAFKRIGGVEREIHVIVEPALLIRFNTTIEVISKAINRALKSTGSGVSAMYSGRQSIAYDSDVTDIASLAAVPLTLNDTLHLTLGDIAQIYDTVAPQTQSIYVDGKEVVAFDVTRATGFGEVDVAARVKEKLLSFEQQHPNVKILNILDNSQPVYENYLSSNELFYEGAVLAITVIFIFLRSWRSTLVAAISLPLSILPTFVFMYFMGFSLNLVTLLSLSLIIGVLVDDSIVEVENIERHLKMGKTPLHAAQDAANEIGLAVIATSFCLIAVFLPTAFMQGVIGRFFVQFGWTCAIAIFFSLLVARLLTPMLASRLLKTPHEHKADYNAKWIDLYLAMLRWSLGHRAISLCVAVACISIGVWLAANQPTTFIPAENNDTIDVSVTLPQGSRFSDAYDLSDAIQKKLSKNVVDIKQIISVIGEGEKAPNSATSVVNLAITLDLVPKEIRAEHSKHLLANRVRQLLKEYTGVLVQVGGKSSRERYTLVLAGNDPKALQQYSTTVLRELQSINGAGRVTSSLLEKTNVISIQPIYSAMAQFGKPLNDVLDVLRYSTTGGDVSDMPTINFQDRAIPIVMMIPERDKTNVDILKSLPAQNGGDYLPLGHFVDFTPSSTEANISRLDQKRNITFNIELNALTLGEFEQKLMDLPSIRAMPSTISMISLGDAEMMNELSQGFITALLGAALALYLVLVLLFKNVLLPINILVSLLLAIPGAFVILHITSTAISLPAMIGLIMLMGLAAKNAILLTDYILLALNTPNTTLIDAIIEGSSKRVRPIIMTTIAMLVGMLPMAIGLNGDPSFRVPMGLVVIGGLMSATTLTLFITPILFSFTRIPSKRTDLQI